MTKLVLVVACAAVVGGLSALAQSGEVLPEKITLLVDVNLPVSDAVGEIVQPVKAGTEVKLESLNGEKVKVTHGLGEGLIEISKTDFAQRVAAVDAQEKARQAENGAPVIQERQNGAVALPSESQSEENAQNKPRTEVEVQESTQQQYGGIARVTAADLTAFYESNELNAERELRGKNVVVIGEVRNVSKSIWGIPYVSMDGSGMWSVYCSFPRQAADLLANLNRGQAIAVRGKVGFKMMDTVALDDCELVE